MSQSAYAKAGVDIEAGDRAVKLMSASVKATHRPEVVGGIGGFAGLFDASAFKGYRRPLLATSTDGVGTKVAIAQALDKHDTIGWDLVGMLVDDLVVVGAEPLFVTDYIACGTLVPERIAAIVSGIAAACAAAGASLLGGETAEHPGCWPPTSTTSPEPPPASSRPTRCSARTGSSGRRRPRRWRPAGSTRTATRWYATCSCSRRGSASTRTSPSWDVPSARSCSSRQGCTRRTCSPSSGAPRSTR
jgi:hypothetical protein